MLMLAVQIDKHLPEFSGRLGVARLTVDVGLGGTASIDRATKNALAVAIQFPFLEPAANARQMTGIEAHGDFCTILTVADQSGVRPIAQGQAQGVQHNGLASAGLTGQHGESGLEIKLQVFNNGEVSDMNVSQHKCVL